MDEQAMEVSLKGKSHGNGNGTENVYFVEARYNYHEAKSINGVLLDLRWKRIHFPEAPIGVPRHLFSELAKSQGFMNYEAAMALAMWFIAEPDWSLCVEVRLVKVKFEYSYNTEEIGVGEAMSGTQMMRAAKYSKREPDQKEPTQ